MTISKLTATYVVVFVLTLIPSAWCIVKTVKVGRQEGWSNLKTVGWLTLAAVLWFSPSIVTGLSAVVVGFTPTWLWVGLVVIVSIGVIFFVRKLRLLQKEPSA